MKQIFCLSQVIALIFSSCSFALDPSPVRSSPVLGSYFRTHPFSYATSRSSLNCVQYTCQRKKVPLASTVLARTRMASNKAPNTRPGTPYVRLPPQYHALLPTLVGFSSRFRISIKTSGVGLKLSGSASSGA